MTQLALAVNTTDELWTLDNLPTPEAPYVEVGDELIEVRSRFPSSYYTLTGETLPPRIRVRRGIAGTTAASHIQGSTLTPNYGLGGGGDGAGGVAVVDAVSADIGTLAQIIVADTDPGAVGAGNMWLQTDPTDTAINLQLWLRTEADDGWTAVGVGDTFEDGNPSGFRAIDALGVVLASVKVDPDTGEVELLSRDVQDTALTATVRLAGAGGLYLSGEGNDWQTTQQSVYIAIGDAAPTAGSGIDLPNGSLYIRPDAGSGNAKLYLLAGLDPSTDWLRLFVIPAVLPEIPAVPTEQDIVDALVLLGLVTQAV